MTQTEILNELNKFPPAERITIIEAALHLIHVDLRPGDQAFSILEKRRQLTAAAEALLPSYSAGGELTEFTSVGRQTFGDNDA